ncbi:leucine--tRNA ligase [Myxococcota bacterium]|nr:leucine--tRNA ligase [Myxococcota bacterium]
MANHRYDPSEIEPRWQARWLEERTFRAEIDPSKPKFYVLDMFPYPSGAGLHVGHPEGYTATDIVARYKRMRGFNVLHPMGWDAFGLPTERAAVREGRHPQEISREYVANFRRQIQRLGFSYDWDREVDTSSPDYYRWTQWIFLRLLEKGLAYEAEVPVNWCPALGTVLANEEVKDGVYVETGDPVEKKQLRQWMLRITAYAERLLTDLEGLDWPESIKEMQRHWIGRSEGAEVRFAVDATGDFFDVFTTRPDTLFGATYCVLAPEHPLVERIVAPDHREEVMAYAAQAAKRSDRERAQEAKEKTGVFTGAYAVNPASGERLPIWIADYVLMGYGTGAIMAVPGHDERDHEFARAMGLQIRQVVDAGGIDVAESAYPGDGPHIHSAFLDGLDNAAAKRAMTEWLEERGLGKGVVRYRLRDWLFSRQRYWGEPIPVIRLPDGTVKPAPEDDLPITLPALDDFRPTAEGDPPLARAREWMRTRDPATGAPALRETNTMPQWAGSCWYYLRFCDARNAGAPWSAEAERYWMPVDLYVGGAEHAVLHLLYARFWHKVLYDCGLVHTVEPFQKLFNQGMILAYSFQGAGGRYYYPSDVEETASGLVSKSTGAPLTTQIDKMSKSRYNVVNPDDVVAEYGADALRLYEMFMGPLEAVKPWTTGGIEGVYRFLQRVYRLAVDERTGGPNPALGDHPVPESLDRLLHRSAMKVEQDIEGMRFNTAISQMMVLSNELQRQERLPRAALEVLLRLLHPFAPHLAEECWSLLGHTEGLSHAPWPTWDAERAREESVTFVVQVDGRLRGKLDIVPDAPRDEVLARAKQDENVARFLEGREVAKEVFVPGRLVNFILKK